MPAAVPPYPVPGAPHTDLQIRALYARLRNCETLLGVAPTPAPDTAPVELGNAQVIKATPVKLFQGFVDFDKGWFHPNPLSLQPTGPAIVLGTPKPPYVVLQVWVTLDTVFSAPGGNPLAADWFTIGTSASVPAGVDARRYYAWGNDNYELETTIGWDFTMRLTQPIGLGIDFKSVGVVQTVSRPILAGFVQPTFRVAQFPEGQVGRVHVMVVYADTPEPELIPLELLVNETLLSVTGPRRP